MVSIRCMADYALTIGRIRTGLGEDLARAMQGADYLARHAAERLPVGDDRADRLWAYLDDDSREKNRAAVDGWRTALDKIGLRVVRNRAIVSPYSLSWIERDFVAEHLHEAWRDVMDSRRLWDADKSKSQDRQPWALLPEENRGWSVEQSDNLEVYLGSFDFALEEKPWRVEFVEQIAKSYYVLYNEQVSQADPGSWADLDEDHREANRQSARALLVYLQRLGMSLVPALDIGSTVSISDAEIEALAPVEHRRWIESKLKDGWTLGARSSPKKTHPDMVPWADLPESVKEKDRLRIRLIPELFERLTIGGVPHTVRRAGPVIDGLTTPIPHRQER